MKNTVTHYAIAGAMAAAFAGSAVADETPIVAPQVANPLSLEVGVGYNFASRDVVHVKDSTKGAPEVDTLGVDLTALYKVDANNALNIRLGFSTGADEVNELISDGGYWTRHEAEDYTIHTFTLTAGYRFTAQLTDALSCYVGANLGIANSSLRAKYYESDSWEDYFQGYSDKAHSSAFGLAYSAEAGFNLALGSNVSIFVAYQFIGNTAKNKLRDYEYGGVNDVRGKAQVNHGIRAGLTVSF